MKSKHKALQQFSFLNKYLEGDNKEFLEEIAPEIGFIVFDFNLLEERLTPRWRERPAREGKSK